MAVLLWREERVDVVSTWAVDKDPEVAPARVRAAVVVFIVVPFPFRKSGESRLRKGSFATEAALGSWLPSSFAFFRGRSWPGANEGAWDCCWERGGGCRCNWGLARRSGSWRV